MKVSVQTIDLPFQFALSFEPLIRFWKTRLDAANVAERLLAENVLEQWEAAPELHGEIENRDLLEKHQSLVDLLITAVVAPASDDQELLAVSAPFDMLPIKSTPAFAELLSSIVQGSHLLETMDNDDIHQRKMMNAYTYILQDLYGIQLDVDQIFTVSFVDAESNLERHFKIVFNSLYTDTVGPKKLPKLSDQDLLDLKANFNNLEFWQKKLPLNQFKFSGIIALRFVEITDQEVLSSLKNDLLSKDAVVSKDKLEGLQQNLRSYFRLPELQIGVASMGGKLSTSVYLLRRLWNGLLPQQSMEKLCDMLHGSIYEMAASTGQIVVIEDLKKSNTPSALEVELLNRNIRSLIIAPIFHGQKLVGMLELGSPNPSDLNSLNASKVQDIMPLFSVAMSRSVEEMENEVQAIIKTNYTAIHPTIEWRFEEASMAYLDRAQEEENPAVEPILFPEVYPLYGLSDIRGSSVQRNTAIKNDLLTHLKMAFELIKVARKKRKLPIIDEMSYRIGKHIKHLNSGLNSGDEMVVVDFIRHEIEPMLRHLRDTDPDNKEKIDQYFLALDPDHGLVYQHRKAYEDSINLINDTISTFIDDEEATAQSMFPHYFEKYKTDGVDYNIYIGASLVHDQKFDPIYLRNFRLWQLMMMIRVSRLTYGLMDKLPVPLRTTELILAYSAPLSIRFRLDEKKFDVDGAYNMRYEIVKKRIDKAYIKNTEERVTQPGKIAIVYNHSAEAEEYLKFIEYLSDTGYLQPGVEELELEALQGVVGLRALRVEVNLEKTDKDAKALNEILELLEQSNDSQ